jgi:hypothetical protein
MRESHPIWLTVGGVLATVGGGFVAVGFATDQAHGYSPWHHAWFLVGFAAMCLGLLVLSSVAVDALVLHHKKRDVEGQVVRSPAHDFAASFLEEAGIRPSYWQRIRHPRTSKSDLPVRLPREVREQYRVRQDALQEFIDELENNSRDLGFQVRDGVIYGTIFPGTAWEKHRHLLNSDDLVWARPIVQDAYLRTHALNPKTEERYDAASVADVNDPEWRKLTEEELQERKEARSAVVAARGAVRQARDGKNPGDEI